MAILWLNSSSSVGRLHVGKADAQTEDERQYRFGTIDHTSKAAFAELHPRAKRVVAAESLRRGLGKLPYDMHTALTDNGGQLTLQLP